MSKEKGQIYFEMFLSWKDSMTDKAFSSIVYPQTGRLNRGQIRKLSGISAESLKNNSQIKEALRSLEEDLQKKGILPSINNRNINAKNESKIYEKKVDSTDKDIRRIGLLESENYDLRLKLNELEKQVFLLKERLRANNETLEAVDELQIFRLLTKRNL